jgi:hypothetical protein
VLNKVIKINNHPNKSAPPKSSSYSTFGSYFLTSFFGYYFFAGTGAVVLASVFPAGWLDPTFALPALINYG